MRISRSTADAMAAIALAVCATVVSWVRLGEVSRGTLWAEDGQIFLEQRLDHGFLDSLFAPYAGYQQLLPRLMSGASGLLSLERYAIAMAGLGCVVVGAVCAAVFVLTADVVRNRWLRALLGSLPALVPLGPIEVLGNAANVHTYLLWLTPWLLVFRPRSRRSAGLVAVVVMVSLLSEIQALIFFPLMFVGWRDRLRWPVIASFVLAAAAQLVTAVASPRPSTGGEHAGVLEIVRAYLLSAVMPLWHPSTSGAGSAFAERGWPIAIVAAVPVAVVLVLAAVLVTRRRLEPGVSPVIVALAVGGIVPFAFAIFVNPTQGIEAGLPLAEAAARFPLRYGVAAELFVLGLAVVLADVLLSRSRAAAPERTTRTLRLAAALLVVAVVAPSVAHVWPSDTRRSAGPEWSVGVAAARDSCRDRERPRPIRAAPRRFWAVTLSCARLESGR